MIGEEHKIDRVLVSVAAELHELREVSRVQHATPIARCYAHCQHDHRQADEEVLRLRPVLRKVREEIRRQQNPLVDNPAHHDHLRGQGDDRSDAGALDHRPHCQ